MRQNLGIPWLVQVPRVKIREFSQHRVSVGLCFVRHGAFAWCNRRAKKFFTSCRLANFHRPNATKHGRKNFRAGDCTFSHCNRGDVEFLPDCEFFTRKNFTSIKTRIGEEDNNDDVVVGGHCCCLVSLPFPALELDTPFPCPFLSLPVSAFLLPGPAHPTPSLALLSA